MSSNYWDIFLSCCCFYCKNSQKIEPEPTDSKKQAAKHQLPTATDTQEQAATPLLAEAKDFQQVRIRSYHPYSFLPRGASYDSSDGFTVTTRTKAQFDQ